MRVYSGFWIVCEGLLGFRDDSVFVLGFRVYEGLGFRV